MNSHLSEEQISAWLSGERDEDVERHLSACRECTREVDRTRNALRLFSESGTQVAAYWQEKPAPSPARWRWAAAGGVFATAVLAAVILWHPVARKSEPLTSPDAARQVFVRIPYVVPLAPYERSEIVHMDVPVAALIAAGFRMDTATAGESVTADVLVGQDGRPLAVSFTENKND